MAIIGAVFAIIATIALTIYFFNTEFLGGSIGIIAIFCYIIAFGIIILLKLDSNKKDSENQTFKYNIPNNQADMEDDKKDDLNNIEPNDLKTENTADVNELKEKTLRENKDQINKD